MQLLVNKNVFILTFYKLGMSEISIYASIKTFCKPALLFSLILLCLCDAMKYLSWNLLMKKFCQNHEVTKIFTKEIQVITDFEILKTIVFHNREKLFVYKMFQFMYNNNNNKS